MNSRSASSAPAACASASPAPTAPGGLVVRSHSAAMPPVAEHRRAGQQRPRRAVAAHRDQADAAALVGPERARRRRARAPRCARRWRRSADSSRVMRRPVAAPPACTIRRREWPPSSPSASAPWRSASKRTPRPSRSAPVRATPRTARARRSGRPAPRPAARVSCDVELGRVVVGQRGGDTALGPVARGLRQRRAATERHAGALLGGDERGVEPGGAGADHCDVDPQGSACGRVTARRYRTGARDAGPLQPPLVARPRHRRRTPSARTASRRSRPS